MFYFVGEEPAQKPKVKKEIKVKTEIKMEKELSCAETWTFAVGFKPKKANKASTYSTASMLVAHAK